MDAQSSAEDELAELRRRAYGPDADIGVDPRAKARLADLERQLSTQEYDASAVARFAPPIGRATEVDDPPNVETANGASAVPDAGDQDMQNALESNVDDQVTDGGPRQRRRRLATAGIVAAAVLVAAGVYAVMNLDNGDSAETPQPPSQAAQSPSAAAPQAYVDDGALIESGTYRMLVGMDGNEVPIWADLTFGFGTWVAHNYPWVTYGGPGTTLTSSANHGGVAVYQPQALAAGTGCSNDRPNPNVDETPEALAAQLARLPDSTVVQASTAVQAFGRDAMHVQTWIDNQCGEEAYYRVAATLRGGHGISYGDLSKDVVMDFWTMDVGGGVPVVVETWHQITASRELVDQIAATRDSIKFVTGG